MLERAVNRRRVILGRGAECGTGTSKVRVRVLYAVCFSWWGEEVSMKDDNPSGTEDRGTSSDLDPNMSIGNFCRPCVQEKNSELMGRLPPGTPCDGCGKTDVEVLGYNIYRPRQP